MRKALILLTLLGLVAAPALAALKRGDHGDEVSRLQQTLTDEGYYTGPITGYFGEQTEEAVRSAQRSLGLTEDGVVGPATASALALELEDGAANTHQVAPGETLSHIARTYGTSVETLVAINGLASPDRIFAGQLLRLTGQPPAADPSETRVAGITDFVVPVTLFMPSQGVVEAEAPPPSYPAASQWLALTFNGGPDPETTPELLDLLDQYDLKATFFVLGRQVEAYPELAREIVARGHELANHGYDGLELTRLSPAQVAEQLERTQRALEAATGVGSKYFRPAFGSHNSQVLQVAAQAGQQLVLWNNIGARSSLKLEAERWASQLLSQAFPGSILFLPEAGDGLHPGLPLLLEGLRQQGYGSVTLTELLARGEVAYWSGSGQPSS